MKKLLLGIFSLAVFSPSVSAATEDPNKITMVTYFPVPYVAYSEINPSKQLDIGLSNTCSLKLGCSEEEHAFDNNTQTLLTVTNLNVKNGRLNLNAPVATVVNKNTALGTALNGAGEINFRANARMQTLNSALSVDTRNMELSTLKLFPDHINNNFPACAGEEMSWQKVKLRNTEEVYLACGAVTGGCSNTPANITETRNCTTGTGTQTRTWDSYNCKWGEWTGTCQPANNCSDRTYKLAHKKECCASAAKTDTDCWKLGWVQENSWDDYWFPTEGGHGSTECVEKPGTVFGVGGCGTGSYMGALCTATDYSSFWNTGNTDCVGTISDYRWGYVENGW